MAESKQEIVDEIYDVVLMTVNRILHNTKNYNISILKLANPSYAEIAAQLRKACSLMEVLADELRGNGEMDNAHTVFKAKDYTDCVAKIADAITRNDVDALVKYRDELDKRPLL